MKNKMKIIKRNFVKGYATDQNSQQLIVWFFALFLFFSLAAEPLTEAAREIQAN